MQAIKNQNNINIYCDESRHTNKNNDFMVIGALSCPRDQKSGILLKINSLRKKHNVWREFGWKTVSPSRKDFYFELMNVFCKETGFAFRCIVVDKRTLDHDQYNMGDDELGFYKLYYQMLVHWLKPDFSYHIYLDWQQNKDERRFADLRNILTRKLTGKAKINCLEPVSSHNQTLIQLTDLFIGAVGYEWNCWDTSSIKVEFCKALAVSVNLSGLKTSTKKRCRKVYFYKRVSCK